MTRKEAIQSISELLACNWDNCSDYCKEVFRDKAQRILDLHEFPRCQKKYRRCLRVADMERIVEEYEKPLEPSK